ncbi:50S ribosomal protein L24 [Acidiferrobacter sp.]|uniref:50S ribosomal protein L24 n=1 Tax=Acidiferrobacter sp. TaxID=1872107 RepID=UPI00262078CD|nr:50S ribosomal protein L24 [Acidiferrobacter sp.]
MQKIRKGDEVVVRVGKDKGKHGNVLKVYADGRVLVENVNRVKRHVRPNPNKNVTGGIIEREAPVSAANVALFNKTSGKGERVGFRTLDDGRKVRIFKRSGEVVDA